MSMKLSRRSFLGLGAVVAATSAATLSGCAPQNTANPKQDSSDTSISTDWLGAEPDVAENDISKTQETELLIIGAGCAGLAAAATAVDEGIEFILCDKNTTVQDTREYFGAIDTKHAKEAGVIVDKQKTANEIARYAAGHTKRSVLDVWLNESGETFDWVDNLMQASGKETYLEIAPNTESEGYYVPSINHMHKPYYTGEMRNNIYQSYIENAGKTIAFEHELIKLIHSENSVTGAVFKTKDGFVQIHASKGVLLATGGYAANPVMINALQPNVTKCVTASSFSMMCNGDGIKCALWAGADMDTVPAPMIFNRGAVEPGIDAGYQGEGTDALFPGQIFQLNMGSQPFLAVNREGKRFCNESAPYDNICNAAAMQTGGVWCQIFDANAPADIDRFSQAGCARLTTDPIRAGKSIEEVCKRGVETGVLKKADTIEDLANQLGFADKAKEEFLAQIERYNALFNAQADADFGKAPYRLSAIKEAPYYGCWYGGSLLTTIDGLCINEEMQVLDKKGNVIEGLYAAGDCSGNLFAGTYPEYFVGLACGRSTTQGRHVVRRMAGSL